MQQIVCFNPRAREGRDDERMISRQDFRKVSIHAPARGATLLSASYWWLFWVSIHAPARGATVIAVCDTTTCRGFNPRAREGRDAPANDITARGTGVSIHAPARGATGVSASVGISSAFQSTRPRGARPQPTSASYHAR